MGKALIKVIAVMLCQIVVADQQQSFDQASSEYKSMNTATLQNKSLSSQVNAGDYHKGDVSAVSAKNYYEDAKAMESAKQSHFANNPEAQGVHQASNMNKHEIDPNNPTYKKAIGHQANAEKILSDEGERYDCEHIYQDGGKTTHTEKCQVSNIVPMQCSRYPVVNIIDTTIPAQDKAFDLTSSSFSRSHPCYGYMYFNLPYTGILKSLEIILNGGFHGGTTHYWLWVHPFHPSTIDYYHNYGATFSLRLNPYSHVTQNQQVRLEINGREWIPVPDFSIRYRGVIQIPAVPRKDAKVTWTDNCQHINHEACVKMSETCVQGAATRNFGGVNVYQDCWKYDDAYKCGYKKHDNCEEIAKRCDFISHQCVEEAHGFCYAYERTYQCNSAQQGTKTLICGNPNSIQFTQTLDQATPDDFMQAVSALAGVNEMAKDIKNAEAEVAMLKGNTMDCGEGAMGVYDCCDGGGNFLHGCSDSEKALQQARQKKLATYVGRFCAKKAFGVCLAYHQVWCVFESKLARILQEQGRSGQLGISFGSAEHPNCDGILVHDLQRIDFSKIDFREFYDEVKSKVTLPNDKTASSMFNKFKAGKTSPEMNEKQKNSRITA